MDFALERAAINPVADRHAEYGLQPAFHSRPGGRCKSGMQVAEFARMGNLLWLIIVILLILWIAGFAMGLGHGLIHLLLVIAVIVLIFQLITGRRRL